MGAIGISRTHLPVHMTAMVTSTTFIDLQAKNENYVGLFGYADHADIRNVRMLDVNVTGQYQVGGLAEKLVPMVQLRPVATGQVAGDEDVGGLVV